MSKLINQGCRVADVHHRYDEIHGALFGISVFRLLADKLRGKQGPGYGGLSLSLKDLGEELAALEAEIKVPPEENTPVTGADRELQQALLEYAAYLSKAMAGLENICRSLEQDEAAYRSLREDGRSRFSADKLDYDHILSELERQGTKLDRLFSNY
jgi:hypothetical protein